MVLSFRKRELTPIEERFAFYSEDDLFDVVEFLYQHVSKPVTGHRHDWNECGMHWDTFSSAKGRVDFCERINSILGHYHRPFELSANGEVLQKPEAGFEQIFQADVPTDDNNIKGRVDAAVLKYRRHGSTFTERREAVRTLADVLEYLRPKLKAVLTAADENDLFNIANNFSIRHHNQKQKANYDAAWLSWMFYINLATIHAVLRKLPKQ